MCTKSQRSGQNHKNPGVIRAIFPKCPDIRARPDISGRVSHTDNVQCDPVLGTGVLINLQCAQVARIYTGIQKACLYERAFVENCLYNARIFVILPVFW